MYIYIRSGRTSSYMWHDAFVCVMCVCVMRHLCVCDLNCDTCMSVCDMAHADTLMHTHIRTRTHTHTHSLSQSHTHIHTANIHKTMQTSLTTTENPALIYVMHLCMYNISLYTHTHTHTHTRTHTNTHTHKHTHPHAHTHTHTRTHTHTHTHTHTLTHKFTQLQLQMQQLQQVQPHWASRSLRPGSA